MRGSLRPTGVNVLGDLAWGTHACLFYETNQDLLDVLVPYVATGLAAGEACACMVSDPLTVDELRAALAEKLPDPDAHVAAGRLDIRSANELFLNDGTLDPERFVQLWYAKLQEALDRGCEGLRIAGNALKPDPASGYVLDDFERHLHTALKGRAMIALCCYWLLACRGIDVFDAARNHEITIARRHGAWEFVASAEAPPRTPALTRREREVLTWIARGKTAWEIGGILEIAKRTVDEHTHASMRKLGAANRTQAVAIALRSRIIDI